MRKVELEAVNALYGYIAERMKEHPNMCPWVIPVKTALWLLREGEVAGALQHIAFHDEEYQRKWEAEARRRKVDDAVSVQMP